MTPVWPKNQSQARTLALALFVVLGGLLLFLVHQYHVKEKALLLTKLYAKEAGRIRHKAEALIEEKKNATLAVSLALAQDAELRRQLEQQQPDAQRLEQLSLYFRNYSQFKNLWIRLQNPDGKTLARSGPLNPRRPQVSDVNLDQLKYPGCDIRLDSQDLGFHAQSPIRNQQGQLLGSLKVISHFSSIVKQLEGLGYESLVLVQPQFKDRISAPFSGLFIEDRYVANLNPNQRLLELIRSKGMAQLSNPGAAFVLEPEHNLLVVSLSIFDRYQQPLGNIFMFRSATEIHAEALQHLDIRVQLMAGLGLLALAGVLYLFANRRKLPPSQGSPGSHWFFVGIFIVLALLQVGLLRWVEDQRQTEYLALRSQDIEHHFNYIKSKYQDMAQVVFQTGISRPDILALLASAYEQGKEADSRRRLLELLILDYEKYFRQQLRQLQFHLRDNRSFLRFHRPGKYGDDLSERRPMVRWVNQQQQPVHGFETGRIFSGFRSVFPLGRTNAQGAHEHLGSVEIAYSAYAFAKELAQELDDKVGFLVPAEQVDGLIFKEDQERFIPSSLDGFYYQKETHEQLEHAGVELNLSTLDAPVDLAQALRKGQIFSLGDKEQRTLFSFIPLENPITRQLAAVLVLQSQDSFLANRTAYLRLLLAVGLAGALLISLFSWRSHEDKARIQALLAKTQSILDAQSALMVISNGITLLDHNRQLLDFFGVPSGEVLRSRYACICEAFIKDDKFFHLGKVPQGVHWLAHLEGLPKREHIVSMRDLAGRPRAFALTLSRFDGLYIISFTDISDTMREHFDLAERVVRDKLTGAYNREFFANRIAELIEETDNGHLLLGFILFDIDHFKAVNDSYGHARGDLVLIQITQLVERTLRYEDILIRWGGEEFLILAKVPSIEQLIRITENLRTQIEADSHPEVGQVTCSFGISLYQNDEPPEETLERADQALYRAKEAGRNRVEVLLK